MSGSSLPRALALVAAGVLAVLLATPAAVDVGRGDAAERAAAERAAHTAPPSSVRPPAGVDEPVTSGPSDPDAWRLALDEDFDAETLDPTVWRTEFRWGPVSTTTPDAVYVADHVLLDDGIARLRADATETAGARWTTGMLTTAGGVFDGQIRYAYIEVRARMARGRGLWPAIWLVPADAWPPEIDIMESVGLQTTLHHTFIHYLDADGTYVVDEARYAGPDLAADFHTFAVEWTPESVRWFLDGVEIREPFTRTEAIPSVPMDLYITHQVGGAWPGDPDETTPFPADFEIDWVRVWEPVG